MAQDLLFKTVTFVMDIYPIHEMGHTNLMKSETGYHLKGLSSLLISRLNYYSHLWM